MTVALRHAISIGIFGTLCGTGIGVSHAKVPLTAPIEGPNLDHFRAIYEPAIRDSLVDPDSAKFEWPYKFGQNANGEVTCGLVNAKNRMGGYNGRMFVIAVYNEGSTPYFNIAENESDGVTGMCRDMIRRGHILLR